MRGRCSARDVTTSRAFPFLFFRSPNALDARATFFFLLAICFRQTREERRKKTDAASENTLTCGRCRKQNPGRMEEAATVRLFSPKDGRGVGMHNPDALHSPSSPIDPVCTLSTLARALSSVKRCDRGTPVPLAVIGERGGGIMSRGQRSRCNSRAVPESSGAAFV